MKKHFIFIILFFTVYYSLAQQNKIDSIKQVIKTAKTDTFLIKTYLHLGDLYKKISYDTAFFYFNKALKLAKNTKNTKFVAKSYSYIATFYLYQNNYTKALEYYQKSLKINKKHNYKTGVASNLGNIGIIYWYQKNYPKALEYYQQALRINTKNKYKIGIASNLGNIGVIYSAQGDYKKALYYYQKALKINKDLNDKYGIAINFGNIGNVYKYINNYTKALEYYQKALDINNELGNKRSIAINFGNIADLYNKQKQFNKALLYANKALKIAKEINDLDKEKYAYQYLSYAYEGLNNFKKALKYKDKYIKLKDSIFNDDKRKSLAKLEAKYEYEKKAAIDSIENIKQLAIKDAKIEKIKFEKNIQYKQRNYLLIGLIFTLFFVAFIISSYIQKQKANKLLTLQKQKISEKNIELNHQAEELKLLNENLNMQNEEISAQRDKIEIQKNKIEEIHYEVSQSINYATRLQKIILPEEKILQQYLSEHFVLFIPKDKVSGDFYWWTHFNNHTIIAVSDCTGHGIPGAFMSILGVTFLRKITEKEQFLNTGKILNCLRQEIIKALKQKGVFGEQKDGMDMAIISINHETNTVQFSGANNPIYIITNYELRIMDEENTSSVKFYDNSEFKIQNSEFRFYEVKPNKMPIAIYEKMDNFTTHEFQLQKGDQLYMFSDGFADQFGGPKGKKFKYKPFKHLLLENADKPMNEQKEILEKTFNNWRKNYEQIDDVTVLGIKI